MAEWVNAKDTLPDKGEDVLVYIEMNAVGFKGEPIKMRRIAIGWYVCGRWHVDGYRGAEVLQWRAMPDGPGAMFDW